MPNHKHLTLDSRSYIHSCLSAGHSFRQIALHLDKDPSTIPKEVRHHRMESQTAAVGYIANRCVNRFTCTKGNLCSYPKCNHDYCRHCSRCDKNCPEFQEDKCARLMKPPYVCNGCENLKKCSLKKYFYHAVNAHNDYHKTMSESRQGISFTEDEIRYMNSLIAPLVKKKQSLHHICVTQADKILCGERTIYKLVDQSLLSVRNIDLLRKVRYRPRRTNPIYKVDRSYRAGRSYQDFQKVYGE